MNGPTDAASAGLMIVVSLCGPVWTPPPVTALFPESVLRPIVSVPWFSMPPPFVAA